MKPCATGTSRSSCSSRRRPQTRIGGRVVRGTRAHQFVAPGLEQDAHRLPGPQDEAQRARARALLAPPQHQADVVHVHRVQLQPVRGQQHRAADLQEAAHPAVGHLDLRFVEGRVVAALHLEAAGIDRQPRGLVVADLLELVVERLGVVDVGGAEGVVAHAVEDLVAAGEHAVARLVLAEALEEHAVGMHRDHRVEHEPGFAVDLVEVVEVALLCPVEGLQHGRLALAQHVEFLAQRRHAGLELVAARHVLREQFAFLAREPFEIGALVARLEAQVAHHHVVQRRHAFAKRQVPVDLADEVHGRAQGVGRELQRGAGGRLLRARVAEIAVLELHAAGPPATAARRGATARTGAACSGFSSAG
ncbi:hypothetical protein [Variovorax paradoxus]|uniref:hypothetical protein n=1 Tax=Variovorax paradoxus TaxID=34073 RepID=UPI0039961A20